MKRTPLRRKAALRRRATQMKRTALRPAQDTALRRKTPWTAQSMKPTSSSSETSGGNAAMNNVKDTPQPLVMRNALPNNLTRSVPIKPISKKRTKENRERARVLKAMREADPMCKRCWQRKSGDADELCRPCRMWVAEMVEALARMTQEGER